MPRSTIAPPWVWVALGEAVDAATAVGGALVLGSIVLGARAGDPAAAHA